MILNEIHFLPTHNTPEIFLSPDGIIKMKGRAMTLYMPEFLKEVMAWIDVYLNNPAGNTQVIIGFEYINSYWTIILLGILRKLLQANLQSEKLEIQWYYEEDDDDTYERGQYISGSINIPFKFIIINRVTEL